MNRREALTAIAAATVAAAAPAMAVQSITVKGAALGELFDAEAVRKVFEVVQPWRVFRVSEYEWYVARNAYEALAAAARDWGCEEIPLDPAALLADLEQHGLADAIPLELSAAELDGHSFVDEDGPRDCRRPFREELALRVAGGLSAPELFAATDW